MLELLDWTIERNLNVQDTFRLPRHWQDGNVLGGFLAANCCKIWWFLICFTTKMLLLADSGKMRLYPKICVNHKRALSEISKLREHFDESRAYS